MKPSKPLALALIAVAVSLTACQSREKRQRELAYVERPVEQLYNQAGRELDSRDFETAILLFNEVERQHPYSEWARKAMVMTAYAHYERHNYDEAISAAQRYISLHPGGSEAAYAYYLIAISQFEQIVDVGRDQGMTEQTKASLQDVLRRFPNSEYARDAEVKLDMVNDQLAGKEMEVGRWYLRSNQTLAAINRFRTVVQDYDTTSHSEEALYRLVEAYLSLGMRPQATEAAATLGYNYPDSDWYKMAYNLMTSEGVMLDASAPKRTLLQRLIPGGK
ncbi:MULTISPECIES: outer membrane protein assembly factor BamD [Hyphomonas]|uniref:Outer membrane protein assembly factor BamD n=1 Tax=Hyphomonas adhaerens TaxID=81029 RepID=A0A3B9H1R5_9PROT|nr:MULTISPECIES: outer membrane protein assembly factor BamD [Hyphomonas]MBB41127.1 outer membrane protein assembly factor BamD [Hyphomonas sp.]HAE28635.1 outer membrane protein assembly factor BamD [Hyphomonas adhaerens]|tara:strand:- start:761 stop:1591 length:831 start_codon:yes stop_codon:yes gene_type:complete